MGRRAPTGLGLDRRAAETTSRAVRWLEQTRDPTRPFFLFVHYFDPHDPYDPPPPFAGRFRSADGERRREGVRGPRASADERVARALAAFHRETARPYDEEIAYADDQLARLLGVLDRLGLADDTIVVMTADHGEGLGQHGWLLHGVNVYEELVRVPLLVRWPRRIPARRVSGAPVEQVDIVPTVLDLVGLVPVAEGLPGRNLAAALRDVTPFDRERPVFLTRRLYEPRDFGHFPAKGMKFAVRLGRWKYIVGQEEKTRELFDLEADPGELRNRVVDEPERATALADLLARWQVTVGPPVSTPALGDEDTARRLRALGYTQ